MLFPKEFMKSKYYYKNLHIFNLVETNEISPRTLRRIFAKNEDKNIDRTAVISSIGNTPTSRKIISLLEQFDSSFLSLHSLTAIEIDYIIINKLKKNFRSVQDLFLNRDTLKDVKIHESIADKIIAFSEEFLLNHDGSNIDSIKYPIVSELKNTVDVLSLNTLYQLLPNNGKEVSIGTLNNAINELATDGKIKITPKELLIKRITIDEFIELNIEDRKYQILYDRLIGMSSSNIVKKYTLSRQRLAQIYSSLISKFPIFDVELRYKNILSEYKMSIESMEYLGLKNDKLVRYVKLKYDLSPEKGEIDFVLDTKRQHTDGGAFVLLKNKKIWVDGDLINYEFKELIEHYIESHSITQFELKSFSDDLQRFYQSKNIDFDFGMSNQRAYSIRLENNPKILSCGDGIYFFLRTDGLTNEFLYASMEYIDNFYGYGSVLYFFANNKDLCLENNINNENVLFAVLKHLYSDAYSDKIQFIRNPTLITKDLTREEFFRELIEEKSPIDRDLFFDYLNENYGLSKTTLYWNSASWFDEFLNESNQLNIKDNEDLSFFQNFIDEAFGAHVILSTDYYNQLISRLKSVEKKSLTSNNLLRKLGYRYSNKAVYKRNYNNTNIAYKDLVNELNKTLSREELLKFFLSSSLDNPRYEDFLEQCHLLRYTEINYLNINKMGISNFRLLEFRDKLINSLANSRIYLSVNLINSRTVLDLFEQYPDVKSIVYSMGDLLFDSLIDSSRQVYSMITSKGLIFTVGERISHKLIIRNVVEEFEEIDRDELEQYLSDNFGLDLEISPGYINELNFYYSQHMNTIYVSKSRFDKVLIDYLDNGEE